MANRNFLTLIGCVTILFAAIDVVWLPFSSVDLDPANLYHLAKTGLLLSACLGIARLIGWRIGQDSGRFASVLRKGSLMLSNIAMAVAIFVPLGFSSAVFMYLASANSMPISDPLLASIDGAMGFSWLDFLAWTNSRPLLAAVLFASYHSIAPQVIGVLLFYGLADKKRKLFEFLALLAVSSVFTAALMVVFPAAGAYAYFQPAPELYSSFTADAGMWHYQELLRLRSGEPFILHVGHTQGLVTFPSYHTALAIMVTYALRGSRLFWPAGVVNSLMVVSTLPEGGHHLIDVIAGAAVAALAVSIVRLASERTCTRIAATA